MSDGKFYAEGTVQRNGYTLASLLEAAQYGFNRAYDEAKAKGFNPDAAIQEGAQARVSAVFDVLQAQYGAVDIKELGPMALISAFGLIQELNQVLQGLESFTAAKPSDFDKVREQFLSQSDEEEKRTATLAVAGGYEG